MGYVTEAWEGLFDDFISKHLRHCFEQMPMDKSDKNHYVYTHQQMNSHQKSSSVLFFGRAIDSLPQPEKVDDGSKEDCLKDQATYIAGVSDGSVFTVAETGNDDESAHWSAAEEIKSPLIASAALKQLGLTHSHAKSALHAYQINFRLLKQAALR